MNDVTNAHRQDGLSRVVAIGAGVFFLVVGVWAMVDPRSFFDTLAEFPPYNQHLIQDIGAFQIGLGAVLVLALVVRDTLAVALLGAGAGGVAHLVSHVVGHDLGGTPETDIPFFTVVALALVVAGALRLRTVQADGTRRGTGRRR